MAKRSRRSRKKSSRNVSRRVTKAQSPGTTAPSAAAAPTAVPDSQEYAYVIADLKRVAILAAGVFALLIGLSFFVR